MLMIRRTRYCSKSCFSRAWPGHSHWCVDHKRQRDKERIQAAEVQQGDMSILMNEQARDSSPVPPLNTEPMNEMV